MCCWTRLGSTRIGALRGHRGVVVSRARIVCGSPLRLLDERRRRGPSPLRDVHSGPKKNLKLIESLTLVVHGRRHDAQGGARRDAGGGRLRIYLQINNAEATYDGGAMLLEQGYGSMLKWSTFSGNRVGQDG